MQVLKQLQIPYSFAKRHGVLLRYEGDQAFLLRRGNASMPAVHEAGRLLCYPPDVRFCIDQQFILFFSSSVGDDSGESLQMPPRIKDDPEVLGLVDPVPGAKHLMDQDDDA